MKFKFNKHSNEYVAVPDWYAGMPACTIMMALSNLLGLTNFPWWIMWIPILIPAGMFFMYLIKDRIVIKKIMKKMKEMEEEDHLNGGK